ncbi:hypothetical protein Tco_1391155, partial [Tanacetum coccineum]
GSEVRKKEQAYNEEQYAAARRRMLSFPFVDEDDYTSKAITPDLPIEEPDNSLNMGDEHLDTIPTTESDEVIKSSVENLVPIPSEFEGISDDTSDVLTCDNNRVNVESDLVESLINRDTSIVYSSKIDPILEEFAGELAHIAPIPPEIVEADFDPNDDTSSDDESFENIEYVDASLSYIEYDSFEEVNDVEQEEKEFDLEDILQIQDVNLRERLLKISRLISNIESLKDNPTPDRVLESPSSFPIPVMDSDAFFEESDTSLSHLDNSLPEFETFSDHTEETRSGSTTTQANYSLPEYDSFLFEIESDQEGLISNDNSNEPLLELPKFESFHFDPSFPRPPPELPDVEICLHFEPDAPVIDNFNELNEDQRGSEIIFIQNVEDDESFTFIIWTFLPFLTYPKASPLSCSTRSEDTIFDPDIITFPFSYPQPVAFSMEVSCSNNMSSSHSTVTYTSESDIDGLPWGIHLMLGYESAASEAALHSLEYAQPTDDNLEPAEAHTLPAPEEEPSKEEEELPASAISAPAIPDITSPSEETEPFKEDEVAPTPPSPISQPIIPLFQTRLCKTWKFVLPQTPLPSSIATFIDEWLVASAPPSPPPSLLSPLSSPLHRIPSPPLPSSPTRRDTIPKADIPPQKRA